MTNEVTNAVNEVNKPEVKEDSNKTFSYEYVKELREENKQYRTKLSEIKSLEEQNKKLLSDKEIEFNKKIEELNNSSKNKLIRAELKSKAIENGMIDLDGLKLADLSNINLDDDGNVVGADELFESLKKNKPYLFKKNETSTNTEKSPEPNKKTDVNVKSMSASDYEAAKRALLGKRK